jgi:hypothetical protein
MLDTPKLEILEAAGVMLHLSSLAQCLLPARRRRANAVCDNAYGYCHYTPKHNRRFIQPQGGELDQSRDAFSRVAKMLQVEGLQASACCERCHFRAWNGET